MCSNIPTPDEQRCRDRLSRVKYITLHSQQERGNSNVPQLVSSKRNTSFSYPADIIKLGVRDDIDYCGSLTECPIFNWRRLGWNEWGN